MFTRTLGRAALVAASLSLATSGTAHAQAQPLDGLWIESVAEVQGQLAAHLLRAFGLSPGELRFRFQIFGSRLIIRAEGSNSYASQPAALAAMISVDQGEPGDPGSTLSILISGAVGNTSIDGTGQIRVNSFDQVGGSLESDMYMTPGGGPGTGGDDHTGGGGGPDFHDYHSFIELYHDPERPWGTASTTTTYFTHNDVLVGDRSYEPDFYQWMGGAWDWQWSCPLLHVGDVFASTSTTGTYDPFMNIGHFTVTFAQPACSADFNADGTVDFFDYDNYVHAFENGTPSADFDHDGTIDFFDYDSFVRAFETPC